MLLGTIDFYHFIPLSLTLTLAGGPKVSAQPLGFILSHSFQLVIIKFELVLNQF